MAKWPKIEPTPENLIIVSDDAGQFNLFVHALCWLHSERLIEKLVPPTEQDRKELDRVIDQIWKLYDGLKSYKEEADPSQAKLLDIKFDEIFTQETSFTELNEALKRIYKNKNELLLVLEHPDIPLHNNTSERGIREYVKRRKISGSTRGESGRRCRDTFTSLKQTSRKLGLSFWDYLNDRVRNINLFPNLSILVQEAILKPG